MIDLTARVMTEIPGRQPTSKEARKGVKKAWARQVTAVPEDARTGFDWKGDWLTVGATVDLPIGSMLIDCDPDGVGLRVVVPRLDGSGWARLIEGSGDAWAQELRATARSLLAMTTVERIRFVASRILTCEEGLTPEKRAHYAALSEYQEAPVSITVPQHDALLTERAALQARIAEIDALLAISKVDVFPLPV